MTTGRVGPDSNAARVRDTHGCDLDSDETGSFFSASVRATLVTTKLLR